ncbi:contractile injection system tape measure protein [Undibacterium danionis]|uniref:Contractile injection system tape measure protein n=1 Tax=Undibacterium danionis TaxID=1812100 RepID=A0ABV6IIP2_9BURK
MKPINRIHQLAFDVNFSATPADEHALPAWIQENLLPVIDQVMHQLDQQLHEKMGRSSNFTHTKRLERLEIDLGTVSQAESANELQRRLHSQLMNALSFEFAEKTEHSLRVQEAHILQDQLLNFLRTGQLAWELEQQGKHAHRHLLNNLLSHSTTQLVTQSSSVSARNTMNQAKQPMRRNVLEECLSEIINDDIQLTRLVRQFETPELFQLIKASLAHWPAQERELILDWISLELLRLAHTTTLRNLKSNPSANQDQQQTFWKRLFKASQHVKSLPALIQSWLESQEQTFTQAINTYAQLIQQDHSLSNTTRTALELVLDNLSQYLIKENTKPTHSDGLPSWEEDQVDALRAVIVASRIATSTNTSAHVQTEPPNDHRYLAILNAIKTTNYEALPRDWYTLWYSHWHDVLLSQVNLFRSLRKSEWPHWLRRFSTPQCLEIIAVLQPHCAWFIARHQADLSSLTAAKRDHVLTQLLSAEPNSIKLSAQIGDQINNNSRDIGSTLDDIFKTEDNTPTGGFSTSRPSSEVLDKIQHHYMDRELDALEHNEQNQPNRASQPEQLNELQAILQAWPSLLQKPKALRALFERHHAYLYQLATSYLLDLLPVHYPDMYDYWQPDFRLLADINNHPQHEQSLRQFLQTLLTKKIDALSAHFLTSTVSQQLIQDPNAEFLFDWIKAARLTEIPLEDNARSTITELEQNLNARNPNILDAAIETGLKTNLDLLYLLRPQLWRHWLSYAGETALIQLARQFQAQLGRAVMDEFFSNIEISSVSAIKTAAHISENTVAITAMSSTLSAALTVMLATRPGSLDIVQLKQLKPLQAVAPPEYSSQQNSSEVESDAIAQETKSETKLEKTDEFSDDALALFERMLVTTSTDASSILSQLIRIYSKDLIHIWQRLPASDPSQKTKQSQLLLKIHLDDKIDLLALLYPTLAQLLHQTKNLLKQTSIVSTAQLSQSVQSKTIGLAADQVSKSKAYLAQFTLVIDELLRLNKPTESSMTQGLRNFYDDFLESSFAGDKKIKDTDTSQVSPLQSPAQSQSEQNLSTNTVEKIQAIWSSLLEHTQAKTAPNETRDVIDDIDAKKIAEATATVQPTWNGLNPLLVAFRQWQSSHLQLAQLALTVEELEQFLHWWILHESSDEASNPPDNYALMLASIKDAMQISEHPALLLELLLDSLRDDQALDLEDIQAQVTRLATSVNRQRRSQRSTVDIAAHMQTSPERTTLTQHFFLRLDELTHSEAQEALITESHESANNKVIVSDSRASTIEKNITLSLRQNIASILAQEDQNETYEEEQQESEQLTSQLSIQQNYLAKTAPSPWQQDMQAVLDNPVFRLWTIEWLCAQQESGTDLSVRYGPLSSQSESEFLSNSILDSKSEHSTTPSTATKRTAHDAVLTASAKNFAFLLAAMSQAMPPHLYQRWQVMTKATFALDETFFEMISRHSLSITSDIYQACASSLASSNWLASSHTANMQDKEQDATPNAVSASHLDIGKKQSDLPAQLRETLPHKLALAMLDGRLHSLEWIWDDIKRNHAKVLQQAQRRYLTTPSLREKIIAQNSMGQLFDLLENLSITAAICLKELWQAWDICRQYLNPGMNLGECQKQSSRAAFAYLLDHDSSRLTLREFLTSVLLSLLNNTESRIEVASVPDVLAACLEELGEHISSSTPLLKATLQEIRQECLLIDSLETLVDWQRLELKQNSENGLNATYPSLDKMQVQNLLLQTICEQVPQLLNAILRQDAHESRSEFIGAQNTDVVNGIKYLRSFNESQRQAILHALLGNSSELEQQKFWQYFAERLQVLQDSQQLVNQDQKIEAINQSMIALFAAYEDDTGAEEKTEIEEGTSWRDLLLPRKKLGSHLSKAEPVEEAKRTNTQLDAIQALWLRHLPHLLHSPQELSLPEQKYLTISFSRLHPEHASVWADFIRALNKPLSLDRYLQLATLCDLARLFRLLRPRLANDIQDIIASIEAVFYVPLRLNSALLTKASWQAIYRAELLKAETHRYQDFLFQLLTELGHTHSIPAPAVAMKELANYQAKLAATVSPAGTDEKSNTTHNQNRLNEQPSAFNKTTNRDSKIKSDHTESSTLWAHESHVLNAGMVIVAPYVQRLFGLLELVQNGAFVDEAAAQRAVHLLQYIVTGETWTPEFQLTLNKLLCGIHGGIPIVAGIDISAHEEEVIQQMLRGVIGHWQVLGSTSIQGLRETFLQRQGNLYFEEDSWRLKIVPGSFDMLLDQLPWSFAMIKFPWMSEPLHVNWR